MPDRGDDGAGAVGGGRAAARPQIEPPRYGVTAPVGGSVKMTLGGLRRAFSLTFRAGLYPLSGRLLAAVADSVLANAGSGRRWRRRGRRRASSRQAADRAAEIRGRRASRGLCRNDIRGLRRAFSLTFRAGLYPLSGRRRADRQPSVPPAPPAGRRRRFLFRECRIGATMAPARSAAPGELSDLRGRRAQHRDCDRSEMATERPARAACWPPSPIVKDSRGVLFSFGRALIFHFRFFGAQD